MNDPYARPEAPAVKAPLGQRLVGVVCTLLLLVGVVAVIAGKDSASADPIKLLSEAPAAARHAGSARMALTMSVKAQDVSVDMTGTGLVDFATHAGSFDFSGMGSTFQLLTDGTTVWMKLPANATAALPGAAGKWVAIPVTAAIGSQASMLDPGEATSYLDLLRGAGGVVVDLGSDEVNGVTAHHYAVTVDLDKATASMSDAERANAEAGLEALGTNGRLPLDVWLDDDGLPVRTRFDIGQTGAAPFQMHMQMDLTDFGVPVHITAPPPDQVLNIGDMTQVLSAFTPSGTATAAATAP